MPLGLDAHHELQVPPLSNPLVAGWYVGAPVPGNPGSGIIASHVDAGNRKGLFFNLSKLQVGDLIYVTRSDGKTAEFRVTHTEKVPKASFPSGAFYSSQTQAQLHLVTCGGRFDQQTRNYLDQILIWSVLVKLS